MNTKTDRRTALMWSAGTLAWIPLSVVCEESKLQPLQVSVDAEFVKQMDALLLRKPGGSASGLVVSIYQNDVPIYQHQSGWANALQGVAVTLDTPFELASVSKPFTALAILQLMEKGVLSLENPVTQFLPELPSTWSTVNLHRLLSHQSGIPDVMNEWSKKELNRLSVVQLIEFFIHNPVLKFEPGQRAEYSNTNYVLLAEVISRVSGLTLDAYWRAHIFEPMGMQSSFTRNTAIQPLIPSALHFAVGEWIDGIQYDLQGAIGLQSSALDVHLFIQGLMTDQLIQSSTYQLMTQAHATFEDGRSYGYGWYITRPEMRSMIPVRMGGRSLAHTGRLGAFRTAVYFDRQDHWNLVVFGNGGKSTEDLLLQVLALARQYLEH